MATVLAFIAMLLRMRYGASLEDESLYIVMPYRLVMGDTPFVNELLIQQTAGLITAPLVWAWVQLRGSTDGIVLFMRVMWLVFSAVVASAAYALLSRFLPRPLAAVLSVLYLTLMPFMMPGLSYNTLGSGFLTIGLVLLSLGLLDERKSKRREFVAGLCHGLAVVAYPTMAIAVVASAACLALLRKGRSRRLLLAYLGGVLLVGGVFGALVLAIGLGRVGETVGYTRRLGAGYFRGFRVLEHIWTQLRDFGLPALTREALVLLLILGLWDRSPRMRWFLPLVPLIGLAVLIGGYDHPIQLWVVMFGLPSLLLLTKERSPDMRTAAALIVPVAIVAGVTAAYSSANGLFAAAVGLAPIMLVALPPVFRPLLSAVGKPTLPVPVVLGAIALVVLLVGTTWSVAHDSDGVRASRMRKMASGPWAGIYGSPRRVALAESVQSDLNRYVASDSSVLFYSPLQGGYLATEARIGAPSSLFFMRPNRAAIPYLRARCRAPLPDYVFRPKASGVDDKVLARPLWYLETDEQYKRIAQRADYDLFERVPDAGARE